MCKIFKRKLFVIENKVRVIYNIVSPTIINKLSNSLIKDPFLFHRNEINVVTVARLSHEKGIDIAIKSCEAIG